MGLAAKKWVENNFDWSKIIQDTLSWKVESERLSSKNTARASVGRHDDPTSSFKHYSSTKINLDSELTCRYARDLKPETELDNIITLNVFAYNQEFFGSRDDFLSLLKEIGHDNKSLKQVLEKYNNHQKPYKLRQIYWLLKTNLIQVC